MVPAPNFTPKYQFTVNESCTLRYWSHGTGPQLIIFICGANGHGSQFNPLISLLSTTYTCATFDRRGMHGSPLHPPTTTDPSTHVSSDILSPPQQARDVVTIIKALGFEKAIIYGSSMGGILAFQVAIDHPEVVDMLIAYEATTMMILDDANERFEHALKCYEVFKREGVARAVIKFCEVNQFVGFGDPALYPSSPHPDNPVRFWEKEFLIANTWNPDWRKLIRNGVTVGVLAGEKSEDAYYVKGTIEQARILRCERMVGKGHHLAHEVEPEEFLVGFLELIRRLEARKKIKEQNEKV